MPGWAFKCMKTVTRFKTPLFYHDKPLFGMDIGHGSLKVMQVEERSRPSKDRHHKVIGYGFAYFDKAAQEDGVVIQPETIAQAALDLFKHNLVGDITTGRVAMAIPAYRTFSRALQLPTLQAKEMREAVELEAEQYISMPMEEIYIDYEVVKQTKDSTSLFLIAVPKVIVDSYLNLARIMGLETVLIESTLNSSGRLFSLDSNSGDPALVIDFGSQSSDISIFDQHMLVAGTVQGGGEIFTDKIKNQLNVSADAAGLIKTRYGLSLSKKQKEIKEALDPVLGQIVKEIRRMLRYYEERYGTERPVKQIITMGGGANIPGLSDYFTNALRMAVRHSDPWQYFDYKGLKPPETADRPMYATVAGLSMIHPKETFAP